ncbi:hypothetical protein MPER_15102, partial [Moniliophthora perniciosa FA553]
MNLSGVLIQLLFPCAAPWYELVYGLTPATYDFKGSPGGLIRIDRLFGSNGVVVLEYDSQGRQGYFWSWKLRELETWEKQVFDIWIGGAEYAKGGGRVG